MLRMSIFYSYTLDWLPGVSSKYFLYNIQMLPITRMILLSPSFYTSCTSLHRSLYCSSFFIFCTCSIVYTDSVIPYLNSTRNKWIQLFFLCLQSIESAPVYVIYTIKNLSPLHCYGLHYCF